jgi:15-cis-phytoene synthase
MNAQMGIEPRAIMDAHAKSFSWAARFLARSTRAQAADLYAFARLMDDLVDEPSLGSVQERLYAFDRHGDALLGTDTDTSLVHSHHVGQMLRSQGVSQEVLVSFLDALKVDAHERHLKSLDDVLAFAYGVAGTVGQMMRPLLGAKTSADRYAVALGMAMQLTNIARDVLEDAQRGRCYLPAKWLPADWHLEGLLQGDAAMRQAAYKAITRLLLEAEAWYDLAQEGFAAIPTPNRRAIRVAMTLYRGIGRKILRTGNLAYWGQRVHVSKLEKLSLVAGMLIAPAKSTAPRPQWPLMQSPRLINIPGFPA